MAGFFGLGGKTKYVDEPDPTEEDTQPFFLEPDDAKTLGNVEFMRKPKTIKKRFPDAKDSPGGEFIQAVSAMEKEQVNEKGIKPASSETESVSTPQTSTETRQTDNSMDMFLQMAKQIKK